MIGIGNGGVSTNGLVFCVDSFNINSYNGSPPTDVYDLITGSTNTLDNGVSFNGRSFVFDGIDDEISVGNLGSFPSFTLNMWFNSSSITDYKNIIDFNGGNTMLRIEQYTAPGYFSFYNNGSGSGC